MGLLIGLVVVMAVLFMIFRGGEQTDNLNLGNSSVFVFKNQNISPTQFGYLIIKLSFDASKSSIKHLKQSKYSNNGLISKVISRPFATELQYIAMYNAAYLIYAIRFCQLPESVTSEIQKGLDDGINDLREPNGSQYDDDLKTVLMHSMNKYVDAHNKDLDTDISVFQPDSSNAARVFVELLSESYGHTLDQSEFQENLMMKYTITSNVDAVFTAIKQSGLIYQA